MQAWGCANGYIPRSGVAICLLGAGEQQGGVGPVTQVSGALYLTRSTASMLF